MLRTNLATRPFYNERAVYLVLGLVAAVGLVALYLEAGRVIELSRLNTDRTQQAEIAEREGSRLAVLAAGIQRSVSAAALDEVAAAAREANLLIDQRVFSWTDFFNRIETTLPSDVMMTEVRPDIEPGSVEVTMGVLGRSLGAIDEFIESLEDSGAFTEVLNRSSEITDDGMYRARLRGTYLQDAQLDVDQSAVSGEPSAEAETEAQAEDIEAPVEDGPDDDSDPVAPLPGGSLS